MLDMLRIDSLTAKELCKPFPLSNATLSEHIRTLRLANLVTFRVRRNEYVYSLTKPALRSVLEWARRFA